MAFNINTADNSPTDFNVIIGGILNEVIRFDVIKNGVTTTVWEKIVFTSQEFAYTGGIQEFVVPVTGTYQLEVWGAQGGGSTGGKGGYSYGNVSLNAGEIIYVVVGGQGGYNGGGSGSDGGYSGGGATHIGKSNAILKSTSSSNLFLVAGGGGGSDERSAFAGGAGGGTSGGDGGGGNRDTDGDYVGGKGGTQTAGGAAGKCNIDEDWDTERSGAGSYGQGGYGTAGSGQMVGSAGGGGGGYYGGSGGCSQWAHAAGGGGSGYIDGVSNGSMNNGIQSGDGKAKITLAGSEQAKPEKTIFANGTFADGITISSLSNTNGILYAGVDDEPDDGEDESTTLTAYISNIDCSDYKYINITLEHNAYVNYGDAYIKYGIGSVNTTLNNAEGTKTSIITLDISSYSGAQSICFYLYTKNKSSESTWHASAWIKISEIKMHN